MARWQRHPAFRHVKWHPTARDLRQFSLAMLIGFGILGLLFAWREGGFHPPTYLLWTVGALLAIAGQVPGLGRYAYLAVYVTASAIGAVVGPAILLLVFALVVTPIGCLLRLAGHDPMRRRAPAAGLWVTRGDPPKPDGYYRQF